MANDKYMNYDNLNKVFKYWRKNLVPYFTHHQTVTSFDEYLKRFSFLPSGKWLKDYECIKLCYSRIFVDPMEFVKKYKDFCITYNSPVKPEDGYLRAIYQLSPTLHLEVAFYIWVENEVTHSYAHVFACYHNEEEYNKFLDDLYEIRLEGDTDDRKKPVGLAAGIGFARTIEEDPEPAKS